MSIGNGGVSIGVSANTQQAQRQISGLNTTFGKLAAGTKTLFGSGGATQVNTYNKHLQNLERNLERVNQRMKTLQGTQAALIQQQKSLQGSGGSNNPASVMQLATIQKALQQNTRSMSFWQAKQVGMQAQVGVAQAAAPPGVGGGGGGMVGFMTNTMTQLAGGIGGGILKALGVGAMIHGAAAIAGKAFGTAADEQKILADLLPRMRMGDNLSKASPKGYMNNFRDMSTPLGFSGVEGLQVASAMSPGTSSHGLFNDTKTAMQMARMFGIDAGSEASSLADAGKMGAFVPGQAKRFAEMLAGEIAVTGMGPRAAEVQEATLSLLHQQISGSGSTSLGAALAQQAILSKTGVPGLQGKFGADFLTQAGTHFGGAQDDSTVAFTEAMLRDQRGVTGYYATRRAKENIAAGKDPRFLGDTIQEAYQLSAHPDAAKDLLSKVLGVPMIKLDEIDNKSPGGLRGITAQRTLATMRGLKGAGGRLDAGSAAAMSLPGNQVREGEATLSAVLARIGTPLVQGVGALVAKASHTVQKLMSIADSGNSIAKNTEEIANHFGGKIQKFMPNFPTPASEKARAAMLKAGGDKMHYGPDGKPVAPSGLPMQQGPITLPPDVMKRYQRGPVPVLPGIHGAPGAAKRSDASGDKLHLHVSFDHSGAIHPHAKIALIGIIGEAIDEIDNKRMRSNTHHRYPRA